MYYPAIGLGHAIPSAHAKDNPRRLTLGTMLVVNYPHGLGRVEVDYVAAALTESFRVPRLRVSAQWLAH
jgi:hypothetical protein